MSSVRISISDEERMASQDGFSSDVESFQQPGEVQLMKRTSNIEIVQDVLRNAGQPLHVTKIIIRAKQGHGVELSRNSIVSALLKKANAGQGIVRTAPNTFALVKEGR
jgi:hypothetical protein